MTADIALTPDDHNDIPSVRWVLHEGPAATDAPFLPKAAAFHPPEPDDPTPLDQVDRARDVMLAARWNELRNRITAVVGFADLLQTRLEILEPEQMRKLTRRLAISTRRLEPTLRGLTDLVQASGRVRSRSRTNVGALVRQVVDQLITPDNAIRLDVQDVHAYADESKVEYMVEQLLSNAFERAPIGSVVWVRVRMLGDSILIAVEDSGPAVADDFKELAFRSARTSSGSAGLGFVARVAELAGGRAWVQDRPAGGASFRVVIPGATGSESGST